MFLDKPSIPRVVLATIPCTDLREKTVVDALRQALFRYSFSVEIFDLDKEIAKSAGRAGDSGPGAKQSALREFARSDATADSAKPLVRIVIVRGTPCALHGTHESLSAVDLEVLKANLFAMVVADSIPAMRNAQELSETARSAGVRTVILSEAEGPALTELIATGKSNETPNLGAPSVASSQAQVQASLFPEDSVPLAARVISAPPAAASLSPVTGAGRELVGQQIRNAILGVLSSTGTAISVAHLQKVVVFGLERDVNISSFARTFGEMYQSGGGELMTGDELEDLLLECEQN